MDEREWSLLIKTLENISEENKMEIAKKERIKFLVYLLYFLGLRIEELAKATWQNFCKINNKWWFLVKGKGDKFGKIPVNNALLNKIINYRHFLNLPPLPAHNEETSLITNLNNNRGISSRQMSNLIKELAIKTAEYIGTADPSYEKFLKFSPHWLRHLSASRQDLAGISFTNIKSNLRHQNEQTTRQYVHSFDDDRHKEMEKLKLS